MSFVFVTMVVQMVFLFLLVVPLPFVIRSQIVELTFKLQKSQNFKVFLTFALVLMGLQFFDCLQKLDKYKHTTSNPLYPGTNYDQLASKFYAQRNLYLSGAILYLQMSISTVITIVRKLVLKEREIRNFGKNVDISEEIVKLKQLIELKQKDIDTMKKQIGGIQTAYNQLNIDERTNKHD
ncbi:unnamed protein product [Candida verbasci]|uniref:Endoplasmic reticulum transmembrane protein n=1 Tax=Candida verbasci TaxID=1227364 RepID=A0A9W4U0B4_9ASCO|nr:unnamed protein product [Candida verbasci]